MSYDNGKTNVMDKPQTDSPEEGEGGLSDQENEALQGLESQFEPNDSSDEPTSPGSGLQAAQRANEIADDSPQASGDQTEEASDSSDEDEEEPQEGGESGGGDDDEKKKKSSNNQPKRKDFDKKKEDNGLRKMTKAEEAENNAAKKAWKAEQKQAAGGAEKNAAKKGGKQLAKNEGKQFAKQGAKQAGKQAGKQFAKQGGKLAVKAGAHAALDAETAGISAVTIEAADQAQQMATAAAKAALTGNTEDLKKQLTKWPRRIMWIVIIAFLIIVWFVMMIMFAFGAEDTKRKAEEANQIETPLLELIKAGPTTANMGDTITYTITVSYPDPTEDIVVTDILPNTTTFLSSSQTVQYDPATRTVVWSAKENNIPLPVNTSFTISVRANTNNIDLINMATGLATPGGGSTTDCAGKTGADCAYKQIVPYTSICCRYNINPFNGRIHLGVDLIAPADTPIRTFVPGIIVQNEYDSGGGNMVKLKDSIHSRFHMFLHLIRPSTAEVGRVLKPGDIIGYVGHTGNNTSTTDHVHYQLSIPYIQYTGWVNPDPVLKDWPTY